jgi:hypothetical protein
MGVGQTRAIRYDPQHVQSESGQPTPPLQNTLICSPAGTIAVQRWVGSGEYVAEYGSAFNTELRGGRSPLREPRVPGAPSPEATPVARIQQTWDAVIDRFASQNIRSRLLTNLQASSWPNDWESEAISVTLPIVALTWEESFIRRAPPSTS